MKAFGIAIMILALVTVSGCSSSTGTTTPDSSIVRPGVGSTFVFRRMYWDTLGVLSRDYLDTQVVYKSGIAYAGKNNVIVMSSKWDTALMFPEYYNYEPNGDFDDYSAVPGIRQGWRTYPIASKGSSSFVQVDSTFIDPVSGQQIHQYREFVLSYVTDSSIVEAGQSLSATDILFSAKNQYQYEPGRTDVWIAPAAGFEVRSITQIGKPYLQNYSRFEFHLVSYTLK